MENLRVKYKNIAIIGAGESGIGAAILALKNNCKVWLSDGGQIKDAYKKDLNEYQIPFEEQNHNEEIILSCDLIIKSPGVPHKSSIIKKAIEKSIPIISEIEYASWFTDAKLIGITGSNGKTTTTTLTYEIFKNAGLNVGLAGNIGKSFARSVAEDSYDYYVLEISSFQLDDIISFKTHIGILLNITPDHLDRYNYNFEEYIDAKFNICKHQTESDFFIYNIDDEVITEKMKSLDIKAKIIPFSIEKEIEPNGAYSLDKDIIIKMENKIELIMDYNNLPLTGKHNRYNTMASGLAAKIEGIRNNAIKEALENFKGIPHRIEMVTSIGDVQFINDSKATNVNSVWFALESMSRPIIWIAGGTDKGNNYASLYPLVKQKVRMLICLGVDNTQLKEAFKEEINNIKETQSMDEAVRIAKEMALEGDAVLLSPACASFDLFQNYEDRGDKFKEAVFKLVNHK